MMNCEKWCRCEESHIRFTQCKLRDDETTPKILADPKSLQTIKGLLRRAKALFAMTQL